MGIFERVKLWWKSKTPVEKVLTVLGGITCAGITVGAVCEVKKRCSAEEPGPVTALSETATDERPKVWITPEDYITCAPASSPMLKADTESEKWEVWNPDWELLYKSESGYETERLNDALDLLNQMDGMLKNDGYVRDEDVEEAEARVEDLARQFAYLIGWEDEFRARFPYLKDHVGDIYENVAEVEKKGE